MTWTLPTRFVALGLLSNGLLTLIDLARRSPELWRAMPVILGNGPNFVAVPAIAYTVLGIALHPPYRLRLHRLSSSQLVWSIVAATVFGLLGWEQLQRGSARLRFDWWDIAATLLGGILCAAVANRMLGDTRTRPIDRATVADDTP